MSQPACDLHMHSYYSDGRAAPEELIRHALGLGLRAIAITDHDSIRGWREGKPIADSLGLALIPAVEFTCHWDQCDCSPAASDIDVLGYFFDPGNIQFNAFADAALADIHERIEICCGLLTAAGFPISLDDVLVHNPRCAGLMFLIDEVVKKGYAPDWKSGQALVDRFYLQVRPSRFTIDAAIAAIHAGGGVAVLAHPTQVICSGQVVDANRVEMLVQMGLDGIEVYHPRVQGAARQNFLDLAIRFDLAVSGGSDDHGWPAGSPRMGSQPVTRDMLEELRRRAKRWSGAVLAGA
jgi:3',5'-nucleoside bisphosphate phosphatase